MDAEKKQKLRDRAEYIINQLPYSIEEIVMMSGYTDLDEWINSREEEREAAEASVKTLSVEDIITNGTAEERAWLIMQDYDCKVFGRPRPITQEQRFKCATMADKVEKTALLEYCKVYTDMAKVRNSLDNVIKDYRLALCYLALPLTKIDTIKYIGKKMDLDPFTICAKNCQCACVENLVKVKSFIAAINHYISIHNYGLYVPSDLSTTIEMVEHEEYSRAIIAPEYHLSEYAKKYRKQKLEDGAAFVPCYADIKIDKALEKKCTEQIEQRRLQHGMSL